jgi:pyridoxal phosphate enzyme (YggS family)
MENKKLIEIKEFLDGKATLVAVSKYRTLEEIMNLYNSGQRVFAENRVQALIERKEALPDDIEWHLIGHLQRNKVKNIVPFIHLIHSVDSMRLMKEIQNQAFKLEKNIKILLQIHVAQEDSKFGLKPIDVKSFFNELKENPCPNVIVSGIMAMATNTEDKNLVLQEFNKSKEVFDEIKDTYCKTKDSFKELSMGMSSDYKDAVKCGSTLVRIGSLLY